MATATLVQKGSAIDYTPGSATAAGAVVVQGDLIGVATRDIAASTLGALEVEGVFDFPKATGGGSGIAVGLVVYWDVGDQQAKTDAEAGANKQLGKTVIACGDNDTTVRVKLTH